MDSLELKSNLQSFLVSNDIEVIDKIFKRSYLADIALILEEFEIDDVIRILTVLSPKKQSNLFEYLSIKLKIEVIDNLKPRALRHIFKLMSPDEKADLINILPHEKSDEILSGLTISQQKDINKLASYKDDLVGSIMTTDFATLTDLQTANEAIESLRTISKHTEIIYEAYVVNSESKLIGTVSLRQLIMASGDEVVKNFMLDPVTIKVSAKKSSAVQIMAKYDLIALPVVDSSGKLVGIITYDDIMDVTIQESEEDFQKLSGIEVIKENFKEVTIKILYEKRIFWLLILVFVNILSGLAIAQFEDVILEHVALVFFLPLLIASAGNAGAQSSTLMVRALGTGDVKATDWFTMLSKELIVAGLLGLSMGIAVSFVGVWRGGMELGMVVALTMQIVVLIGSLIGAGLPFVLDKLKLDPATASGPLVTSISDIVGVVIYFVVATAILM